VPAAVAETGDVTDQDLIGTERMSVGAAGGRFGHPFTFGSDEVALHLRQVIDLGQSAAPRYKVSVESPVHFWCSSSLETADR
jgi:hypothetical protein